MERKDEEREKRVYEASVTGSVSLLKQLMAEDPLTLARAAVTCFNETPLHVAAILGHLDFTKYLLTQKPDMTMAVDSRGRSPLHLARRATKHRLEVLKLLLEQVGEVDFLNSKDDYGNTVLHTATALKQFKVNRNFFFRLYNMFYDQCLIEKSVLKNS